MQGKFTVALRPSPKIPKEQFARVGVCSVLVPWREAAPAAPVERNPSPPAIPSRPPDRPCNDSAMVLGLSGPTATLGAVLGRARERDFLPAALLPAH